MKPVIGISPRWDEEKKNIWITPGYVRGVIRAGGIPVLLPLTPDPADLDALTERLDGIILTGGGDVDPKYYGEEILNDSVSVSPMRDEMEIRLVRLALEKGLSILGICRGLQVMNVAFGGTLYQDLPVQHPSDIRHVMDPPYENPWHRVTLEKGTPIEQYLGLTDLPVNSDHHQAVKDLAASFRKMATSEDGLTEGIYMPDRNFVWGVQWHPECMCETDPYAQDIFDALVRSCRKQ